MISQNYSFDDVLALADANRLGAFSHNMQGPIAANDAPQPTQEQGFQAETISSRQRKRRGVELTPEEIEKRRLERNSQKQEYREKEKIKKETILKNNEALASDLKCLTKEMKALKKETESAKKENGALKQAMEETTKSQAKTETKFKKRAAKWKRKYTEQHDRAEFLENQMLSLMCKLKEFDDKFNHLFKLLGAAPASEADQALYAQSIASRQQHVAASHIQMNSPMVGMPSTDQFQPNSQFGALPSSIQQPPASMEGSCKFR